MIGLGSNRLTVCRRGGMSVTQAGRGGMEWLAGGRRPRWSSPYSAQATAALKAAFTAAQWATIKAYGFAHPALVPFINEDPMLVMSLIEGLGTRWLVGDGNCWIDTGVKPTQYPLSIKMKGIFYGSIQSGDHGMIGCWDGSRGFFIGYTGGRTYLWTGNTAIYPETAQIDTICPLDVKFNASNNVVYQFGGASGTSSSASPFSSSTIAILGGRGGSSYGPLKGGVSEVTMVADGTTYQFVPFKDGNDAKYMDLGASVETGSKVFLTKRGSGSFTISETPAS